MRILRANSAKRINNAKTFLFTTARNLALDLFRRNQVISFESLEDSVCPSVLDSGEDLVECICHDQELELLKEAIAALPIRCREVLAFRKLQGLSREDIARRMGISESTVNTQIAIGMLRCRKYFQERGLLAKLANEEEATNS